MDDTRLQKAFGFVRKLVSKKVPVLESVIKQIYYLVLADKKEDRWVYRRVLVRIMGAKNEPAQPYLIQPSMERLREIDWNDVANREGHAAKVYFNALFGLDFTRTEDNTINAALNYGYSIILSAFTREIVSNGYLTQLGIFHDNMFNQFNLASDFMEPFRVLVDREVFGMNLVKFEHEEKMQLVNLLNYEVKIDSKMQYVNNAIKIYCKSIFDALNEDDSSLIRFYKDEL